MINDLILRATYNSITTDLDVDGDVPLRLDISQVDNQSIGEVFGVSSQNFNLPGTAKNNKFFNHGYLESAVDVPGLYTSIPCSVIRNGETLILGTLQLNEVVTSDDGFITYDVTVNNSVIEFNESLQDKFLYQADWEPYNHTLNTANVFKSWNQRNSTTNPFVTAGGTGSVYYPYIDYGFDSVFTWPQYPVISNASGSTLSGPSGSTAVEQTPLNLGQVYPAIGAREVFKAIFNQAGFSYSSSFIDSSDFDEVFILTKNQEGLGVVSAPGQVSNNLFSGSVNPQFSVDAVNAGLDTEVIVPFTGSEYDPGSNYSDTTYYYTAPIAGRYSFNVQVDFENSSNAETESDAPDYNLYFSVDRINTIQDQTILLDQVTLQSSSIDSASFYSVSGTPSTQMERGDRAAVYFEVNNRATGGTGDDVDATPILTSSLLQVTSAPVDYDNFDVKMQYQIDTSIKSIDMLKALLTQFNLVAYPDQSQQRVINVETFDTWIRQGEVKDWTDKYNSAKRISIKNPVVEQPKELKFQNVKDDDRISKLAEESTPNFQYGTLRTLSNSTLTTGETSVGSLFAPTVLAPVVGLQSSSFSNEFDLEFDQTANNFIIPHLYKFKNSKQESYKFKPRIGYRSYYNDKGITVVSTSGSQPSGSTSDLAAPQFQYIESSSQGNYAQFTKYSTLSNYKRYPVQTSTPDLLFNSSYNKLSTSQTLYPSSGSSNYKNYWEQYTNSLYWEDGRKVVMDLFFEEYEYQDIKLNDQIIINDNRYRINKIQGFNLTRRDIVTVELLKLFPSYTPVIAAGEGTTCPTVETYAAKNITSSSMTLSGSLLTVGSGVLEKGFVVSETDSTPTIAEGATKYVVAGTTAGEYDYDLTGLNPNTTYYYQAYVSSSQEVCEVGYGGSETATTLTSSLCNDTVSASYSGITTSSFTMSGTVTQVGGSETFVRGFVYSSGSDTNPFIGGAGVTRVNTGATYGTFPYNVTGADCGTNYYFRAFQSQSGCLKYSDLNSLTTTACPVPTGSCNAFSASGPTNFGGACSETIDEVLYTDYSGSWPPTQAYLDAGGKMTVYTSAGCSVASFNTYYAFDSSSATGTNVNAFLRVDDGVGANPGDVIYIYDCTGP